MMRFFLSALPAAFGLHLLVLPSAASGRQSFPDLIVTTIADSGTGSLRDTIAAASGGDTIGFDAALKGQTIMLTSGRLVIDKSITISGPGPDLLAVSRSPKVGRFRIFSVTSGHTVTIAGLTISGGYADASAGGGVVNGDSNLTITNCTVSGNFVDAGVGGGGIFNTGTLTIDRSVISNNRAGFTTGNPIGYGGGISSSGTLIITQSMITNNIADLHGGGIVGGGMVRITDSTIRGNRAGPLGGTGGGLFLDGTVEINNCAITGNTATGMNFSGGGGIIITGDSGPVTITNSTISDNFATQNGGGIANGAQVTITNSTLSHNTADRGGSIDNFSASAVLQIANTILQAGEGANMGNDNGGTITSLGYNLSSDDAGGFLTGTGDQINTNPMLGPLQDNGGPTLTHSLLAGSPAINAGDPTFTPPPLYDQRGPGYPRVFNGRVDIGSLEVQTGPAPTPTPTPTAIATASPSPTPAQPLNISTRLRVELGDGVMIGGFIIAGTAPKNVAVRGIGPSLAAAGVPDALVDPALELRGSDGTLILANDDWQSDPAAAGQLTALGLALQDPKESGLLATLQPGSYTAVLSGTNQTTGVGLVEIYDTDQAANSHLANISTRGLVQTGDNVMIGGFILGGDSNTHVVVRGIGPSLAQSGIPDFLVDPILELHDGNGALLVLNDNWQDDANSASQLTALGFAPQNAAESGIYGSLPAGAFTAILAGRNGGTGIGLLEIYRVE